MIAFFKRLGMIAVWTLCGLGAIGMVMQMGLPLLIVAVFVALVAKLNGQKI